jgi:diguanylate cyclase (GGDEF)-like protein
LHGRSLVSGVAATRWPGGLLPEAARLLPVVVPVVLAGTIATALALASLSTRAPNTGSIVGALVLLAAATAAEAFPVPIDGVSAGGVSLAAAFLVGAALIYDWHTAVLISLAARGAIELVQRRPLMKIAYNGAVFALSGAAAGGAALVTGNSRSTGGLLLTVAAAALAFYAVNIPLVAAIVARATRGGFLGVLRQSIRWTAVPFVIMGSISLMLQVMWERSPILAGALAGPLVAVALYQRSVHSELAAMRLAKTDPLTGLGNHRAFHEGLAELAANKAGGETALCLVDVDGFKQINDRHGHQAGDEVLVLLASLIRDDGRAYRLGGDEFAIVVPDVTADEASRIAKTLVTRIGGQRHAWGGCVTVSAGVALFPTHAQNADRLFAATDAALYQAKRHGRNQAHVFDPRVAVLEDARRNAQEARRLDTAWGLAELMDAAEVLTDQDDPTGGHSLRVSGLAARLGARCGLEPTEVELVRLAARLHDLGKLAVPVEILSKPDGLEQREWRVLQEHPETGRRILAAIGAGAIADWVLCHHERWDGAGYPAGLQGSEIPLPARIIFVADAYDAITNARPYRHPRSQADALAELHRCAGTQFDPAVVAMLAAELADEHLYERLTA